MHTSAIFKAVLKNTLLPMLDVLFPPICSLCRGRGKNLLCFDCQEWLAPPDPSTRCRHCFAEMESSSRLCRQCAKSPILQAPSAVLFEQSPVASAWRALLLQEGEGELARIAASLLVLQWGRLEWPLPDRIALIPAKGKTRMLQAIAEEAAAMVEKPLIREFGLEWVSAFEWRLKRKCEDLLEEESLLLIDFDSGTERLATALSELWPAYPKEVHILSLFAEKPEIG